MLIVINLIMLLKQNFYYDEVLNINYIYILIKTLFHKIYLIDVIILSKNNFIAKLLFLIFMKTLNVLPSLLLFYITLVTLKVIYKEELD